MIDDRLILAIGRLERALARAEAALAKRADDAELAGRHEALRAEVSAAITRIDRLIGPEASH